MTLLVCDELSDCLVICCCNGRFFLMRRPTILGMASRLEGFEGLSQDPVVEVDMEVEMEMEKDPSSP